MKKIYGKLSLIVHRVYLRVKFPCSISLLLRKENQELPIGQEVPLRLGEATFQAGTNLDIDTTYNSKQQRFDQKKFFIQVYLKTMSGRVPAGVANFDIQQIKRGINSLKLNIERCPDKEASMLINVVYEGWNQVPAFSQLSDTERRSSERNMLQDLNRMRESAENQPSSLVERIPQNILQQSLFIPQLPIGNQESPIRFNQGQEKSPYRVNINDTTILHQSNRGRSFTKDRQYKNLQRKYEQQLVQLKGINAKSQLTDRNLRENDQLIKSLKQQNQDFKFMKDSLARKMEFIQSSLREQLKNINSKLTNSESQKQRLIYEKNDMINRFEERQRAVREVLREKEKINSEEKFSNIRKIESLSNQLQLYKSKNQQLQLKVRELVRELEAERLSQNKKQEEKRKLEQFISQLKQSLNNQKNERKRLQEELESNTKLEEQKKKFKKKINQLEQELAKKVRNLAIAENNCQKQTTKNEQLENKLKQQQNGTKSERKQNEKLRKQVEQLTKQLKSLNQTIQLKSQAYTHQNAQLSNRLNNQEEMIRKLENSKKKSAKQIQEKNALLQTLQQKQKNSSDHLNQLQKCYIQLEQAHLKLYQEHEKLRILHQLNTNNKEYIQSQKLQIQIQLDSFIKELQGKELEFKKELDKRQVQKTELERKIKQLEQKLSQSNGDSTSQIQTLTSRVQQLTRQSQKKSQELQSLQKYAQKLQEEITNGKAQRARLQEIINTSQGEIQKLTYQSQQLLRNVQDLQAHLNESQQNGAGSQQQLHQKLQKIKNMQNQLEQLHKLNSQYLADIEEKSNEIHCLSDALHIQQERNSDLGKESNLHIAELKQDNKALTNNNQTLHEQLEHTQQAYKQTSNELESTHKKLQQQIKINSGLVNQIAIMEQNFHQYKENMLKNSSSQGDRLANQKRILQQKLRTIEVQFKTQNAQLKQLIQVLEQHYENLMQQHKSYKEKSELQISRLNKNLSDLTNTKLQLQEKLLKISKAGEMKEKAYQAQTEYIKPIKQNLILLRGYMNEYSRVGDQFEANKNKLLKMATVKIEQFSDRNIAEKVREVSLSFQKLKASILGNGSMGEQQKLKLIEQFKKVQFSLDRALRGDR